MTNYTTIRQSLPADVTLVAVSKYHTIEQIAGAYAEGCRDFGESRVQELTLKQAALPKDIRWHFIGHLQTNKVRDLLRLRPYLIQSVDSLHLMQTIDSEAQKQGIIQDILLEIHVAREQTKSGFSIEEFQQLIAHDQLPIANCRIRGIMGMGTNTDDEQEIRRCFRTLKSLYDQWLNEQIVNDQMINRKMANSHLSMGMSDDYPLALAEGSTMLRLGSAIFD